MESPIATYLRELRKRKGVKSDRQFAIQMGISTGMVCNILGGANVPGDDACRKIAEYAEEPLEKVLVLAAESRAPESTRSAWSRILKATATAGLFTLGLVIFLNMALASPALSRTMDIMSN